MSQQAVQLDLFALLIAIWSGIQWLFDQISSFLSAPVKFWHVLVLLYIIDKFRSRFESRLNDVMAILSKWDRGWTRDP